MAQRHQSHPRRLPTWRWLQAYVLAVALCALAAGVMTRPQPARPSPFGLIAEAAAEAPAQAPAAGERAARISEEFSAIRPADLDAHAPAIPPSEVWPAQ